MLCFFKIFFMLESQRFFIGQQIRTITMPIMPTVTSSERVENYILLIRNQKVILDTDLAELYGVSTKRLN